VLLFDSSLAILVSIYMYPLTLLQKQILTTIYMVVKSPNVVANDQ
jgi:hypothetical protein